MSGHAADHHDDPWSHVPPPSPWPFLFAVGGLTLTFVAVLLILGVIEPRIAGYVLLSAGALLGVTTLAAWWFRSGESHPVERRDLLLFGGAALALAFFGLTVAFGAFESGWIPVGGGAILGIAALMGWAHQIIVEKPLSHDPEQQQKDLVFYTKLFLVSELAAFGAIFGYFYHRLAYSETFHPPEGINLAGPLVALATFLLVSSSATCEASHHFLKHGKKQAARWWMLTTIVLGIVFLSFQATEYGELFARHFSPAAIDNELNSYASLFLVSTGFHGVHVAIGLVMLFLVYVRMEMGHFTPQRHFSFIAASLYWHFVDIVWILLFITIYVVQPVAPGH